MKLVLRRYGQFVALQMCWVYRPEAQLSKTFSHIILTQLNSDRTGFGQVERVSDIEDCQSQPKQSRGTSGCYKRRAQHEPDDKQHSRDDADQETEQADLWSS